jgi:DNA-binding helix-hairpin-helix protein with protein kinase domain
MSAARGNPIGPSSKPVIKGPQLVPTPEPIPSVTAEAVRRADPHPLAAALIIGGMALIGAITLVGSLASWILLRNTGVNWMFQGR